MSIAALGAAAAGSPGAAEVKDGAGGWGEGEESKTVLGSTSGLDMAAYLSH